MFPVIRKELEYDRVSGVQVLARAVMNWSFVPGNVGLMVYKARSLDMPRKMATTTHRESYSTQRVVNIIDFGQRAAEASLTASCLTSCVTGQTEL